MKKIFLLVIIVGIALLCACRPANIGTRPDNSIDPPDNIYVGMSRADFFEQYPAGFDYSEGTCFEIWGEYAFLKDSDGNPVIVYFKYETGDGWVVASVNAYDKDTINVTEDSYMLLERGMNYQDVVSILGCPIPQTQSTRGLDYQVGENVYHLECFGKTDYYDTEYVIGYICIISPDGAHVHPIGTEPWERVDPE